MSKATQGLRYSFASPRCCSDGSPGQTGLHNAAYATGDSPQVSRGNTPSSPYLCGVGEVTSPTRQAVGSDMSSGATWPLLHGCTPPACCPRCACSGCLIGLKRAAGRLVVAGCRVLRWGLFATSPCTRSSGVAKGWGEGVCPYSCVMSFLYLPLGLLGNYQQFCGARTLKISAEGHCAVLCQCWCEGVLRVGTGSQANAGMEDFGALAG